LLIAETSQKLEVESMEEVVNKDTDKEAHVPASVFILLIAGLRY